ncbi:branched-chain amino acid transaminase [Parvularcula dongshanensis]|uniref:Branched-chain-amino-acid aminotransferase n=1 Tax=Parvularcula dongshanensis TaxID=1173995 RepID=A0A840I4X1_9PROT|nr:branched-chain amino acid aminotransferase [Parvularcula dongshanensis]
MPIQEAKFIWKNGEMIPWAEATTHVLTHALLYGTCAFEGIRAYDTPHKGTCVFRLEEHTKRLFYSARIYGIGIDYSEAEVNEAILRTVRENELKSAYIRVNAYLGYGEMSPSATGCPDDLVIAAFPWGRYLGAEAIEEGIDACVSSWRRTAQGTLPAGAKVAGNYLSSRLITTEAKVRGMVEGIGLSHDGTVSEGGGENLFIVKDGRVLTPPLASSILGGITRDTVLTFLNDMNVEVVEQAIPRELLYGCDELFMTGTAAEVTPVRSVDGLAVGGGNQERPVTKEVQKRFFGLFDGTTEDEHDWLRPVKG